MSLYSSNPYPCGFLGDPRNRCNCTEPEISRSSGLLEKSVARLGLSARAYHRVLKMARTIADMEKSPQILQAHVAEAVQFCRNINHC